MRGIRERKVKDGEGRHTDRNGGCRHDKQHGILHHSDGRDIKPFKFGNTREGLDKFWSIWWWSARSRFRCNESDGRI